MRRKRHRGETKVWHDPLMVPAAARRNGNEAKALEAEADEPKRRRRRIAPKRTGVKLVAGPVGPSDPKEAERERLLHRVLAAEGRPSISTAVDDYVQAGFDFPQMQDVWLQMLEHRDEGRVAMAIARTRTASHAHRSNRRNPTSIQHPSCFMHPCMCPGFRLRPFVVVSAG